MVKKRKLETQSNNETPEPSQTPKQTDEEIKEAANDEEVEYEEVEVEEEDNNNNPTETNEEEESDDDEPIQDLLEPFSKDQLLTLLKQAAESHLDVATRIREVADEDPSHRKIFVHGLGWDTKTETLIEAFKQYGEIEDCKAVFDKISGKSKGYGFILFKSRSGARNALKMPQKKIGSRMTACQLASKGPVFGANNNNNSLVVAASPSVVVSQEHTQTHTQKKIYVSNVGAELDPMKLLAYFSRFGEIEEGPLGLDKFTGRPKGFCLFVYKSAESAKRALEEPHKTFEGHVLHCQKAIDGPKPGKQVQSQQQQQHHNVHARFQRSDNGGYGVPGGHGHLMGGNQVGMGAGQVMNPAINQALALLASQGAGLAFNPAMGHALLGSLGTSNPGAGMPTGYGTQAMAPGTISGYTAQPGLQGGYQTPQPGQGGAGRGQHGGVGQYTPYMGL